MQFSPVRVIFSGKSQVATDVDIYVKKRIKGKKRSLILYRKALHDSPVAKLHLNTSTLPAESLDKCNLFMKKVGSDYMAHEDTRNTLIGKRKACMAQERATFLEQLPGMKVIREGPATLPPTNLFDYLDDCLDGDRQEIDTLTPRMRANVMSFVKINKEREEENRKHKGEQQSNVACCDLSRKRDGVFKQANFLKIEMTPCLTTGNNDLWLLPNTEHPTKDIDKKLPKNGRFLKVGERAKVLGVDPGTLTMLGKKDIIFILGNSMCVPLLKALLQGVFEYMQAVHRQREVMAAMPAQLQDQGQNKEDDDELVLV